MVPSTKESGRITRGTARARCSVLMERYTKAILKRIRKRGSGSELIRLTYPNDKIYKGGFRNNNPHGKGTLYQPDGTIVNGVWDMGNLISNS